MRKILTILLMISAIASCDKKEVIWDIAPVGVVINLNDGTNNLLSPSYPDNILDSLVTATFKGEKYTLTSLQEGDIDTLASHWGFITRWYGFAIYNEKIHFGEFPGDENIEDQNLIIDWWGASKDTITIRNIVHKGDTNWVERSYHLNGEEVKYEFTLEKKL